MIRQLHINLDEFAFLLHRGETLDLYCFLNASSGEILSIPSDRKILQAMLKLTEESEMLTTQDLVARLIPDGQDYLTIPDNFRQNIYMIMSEFINSIQNTHPTLADNLNRAVHEEGGYEAFLKDLRKDRFIFKRYLHYRDQFFEQSALNWLGENNIELV